MAWGSWGMLGGKGFGALVLWCMEEVRSNVAVRRAGSPNQISQLPAFDKSGEGPLAAQRPHAARAENLQQLVHPATSAATSYTTATSCYISCNALQCCCYNPKGTSATSQLQHVHPANILPSDAKYFHLIFNA